MFPCLKILRYTPVHCSNKVLQLLVDYIIAMSKAVCRFRELTALLGLLLDNIPIKGIKFCGCRGLRFILLLEETQETALLLSFLRTLICYDGNTLGKFFAEFYLLFKQLGDIEELDFFLCHQHP